MPTVDLSVVRRAIENMHSLIAVVPGRLCAIAGQQAAAKRAPDSWSQKEELGHLIDSAANNHQRITRAQMEGGLAMPGYDGDRWVTLHGYQNRNWRELVELWRAGNKQLLSAAESAPDTSWSNSLTVGGNEQTLGFVMTDYVRHMTEHLRHIGVAVDDLLEASATEPQLVYPEKPAPASRPINDLMKRRWSPRAFEEGRLVERDHLLTMLEAARWAPSCFNDQPRFFLVFDGSDAGALERARGCLAEGNAWALKAPVLMLSVARETFEKNGKPNRWAQHDTGLATENLLLEAVEQGLAAHPMAGYDAERARTEFGIPEGFTPIAMIAIGYPYRGSLDALDQKARTKELAPRERKPSERWLSQALGERLTSRRTNQSSREGCELDKVEARALQLPIRFGFQARPGLRLPLLRLGGPCSHGGGLRARAGSRPRYGRSPPNQRRGPGGVMNSSDRRDSASSSHCKRTSSG